MVRFLRIGMKAYRFPGTMAGIPRTFEIGSS
jgi:hypothetical protein